MRWYHWVAVAVAIYLIGDTIHEAKRQAAEALNLAQANADEIAKLKEEIESECDGDKLDELERRVSDIEDR